MKLILSTNAPILSIIHIPITMTATPVKTRPDSRNKEAVNNDSAPKEILKKKK